jgi:hypothetical protein
MTFSPSLPARVVPSAANRDDNIIINTSIQVRCRRTSFLLFVKILLHLISKEDELLHEQCKLVILTSRQRQLQQQTLAKRNVNGDTKTDTTAVMDLQRLVQTNLRRIVGPTYWNRTKDYYGYYCTHRNSKGDSAAAATRAVFRPIAEVLCHNTRARTADATGPGNDRDGNCGRTNFKGSRTTRKRTRTASATRSAPLPTSSTRTRRVSLTPLAVFTTGSKDSSSGSGNTTTRVVGTDEYGQSLIAEV